MGTRLSTLAAFVLLALPACGNDADPNDGTDKDSGGKQDDSDAAERACKLDEGDSRELIQFVNNDHVQFRCRATETTERAQRNSFVESECCGPQIREFTLATGCPTQAKFKTVDDPSAASGKRQRCVADEPDSSEDVGIDELVATSCCQMLCGNVAWDDDDPASGKCRDQDNGQFAPHSCCEVADQDRCGDAVWENRPEQDQGLTRCWAQTGQFANHYATNACCMSQCFLEEGDDTARRVKRAGFPLECNLPNDDECAGAGVNTKGACELNLSEAARDAVGEHVGHWGKAMCCAGQEGLDQDFADECHRRELFEEDLTDCGA
jgi:hypothetical protein